MKYVRYVINSNIDIFYLIRKIYHFNLKITSYSSCISKCLVSTILTIRTTIFIDWCMYICI